VTSVSDLHPFDLRHIPRSIAVSHGRAYITKGRCPVTRLGSAARRATPDDLDAVVDLCFAARAESPVNAQLLSPSRATVRRQLGGVFDVGDMRLFVAEVDDAVAGFALARVVPPGLFSDSGWMQLEALYVDEPYRRRGAGRALMTALSQTAVAEHAESVVTMPLTGSRSEQRFLARLGFAAAGGHRIVDTPSLVRRLDLEAVPPERRRRRGLEHLIAARRLSRAAEAGDQPEEPSAAGVASRSRHVSLAVHTLRSASSVTTIS
jgi:GNAT superfamily N-acetyltransferase